MATLADIASLLTSESQSSEKLHEVARRLYLHGAYETVDFLLLEGPLLGDVRHHLVVREPTGSSDAWEESVQVREAFSAFASFDSGEAFAVYNSVKTDHRLTANEREMASRYGLGSILVVPLVWSGKIRGAIAVTNMAESAFEQRDATFLIDVASTVSALIRQQRLIEELAEANKRILQLQDDTVMMLAHMAEAYDETTGLHLRSMRAITELLAHELGFTEQETTAIGQAALLHDIGKVRVDRRALLKAGPLTAQQRKNIEMHSSWGEALLTNRAGFELAALIARSHHERWDGAGYPDGLSGEQIPLEAAIATLADSYDAMVSVRPYKTRQTLEWAVEEIQQNSGKQFSPVVVNALLRLHDRGALAGTGSSLAAA